MAEIRVEQKRRSLAWLWVLLVACLVALVVWYLNTQGVDRVDTLPPTGALTVPAATLAALTAPALLPARA